jgi:hypothetical protein
VGVGSLSGIHIDVADQVVIIKQAMGWALCGIGFSAPSPHGDFKQVRRRPNQ